LQAFFGTFKVRNKKDESVIFGLEIQM